MDLTQFELLSIVAALLGMWLKSRVKVLEMDNGEFKNKIDQLLTEIQEIKMLLAKNQVQ